MARASLISPELAAFLASGLSLSVATRSDDLTPHGFRPWAAVVDPDGTHVEVFFYAEDGKELLADLEANGRIAVLFVRPTDSRACQLKGTFVATRRAKPSERKEVERQVDGFYDCLEQIGILKTVTAGWKWWPAIAVRFRAGELYDQTPGPGAGEPLR